MQKTFSKEFKFKVAMEAIKSDLTIAEIISKYQVPKTAIHEWKRFILENGSSIFGQKKEVSPEKQVEQLHKIIAKLKVENDFLQDAWNKLKP
ncbi:MAG: transposase [Rickettsiales bacterium]|nr:MAG: transposase [Rickettsiales bacterium]